MPYSKAAIFYLALLTMKCFILTVLTVASFFSVSAQTIADDSVKALPLVIVKGFETNRRLIETPASISFINQKAIQRFSATSLVPVINTVPGVRMEERSPGSYRLSVRGSLLRSPFGIRNIKVYVDDMPFTDAGGNTYINLIEPSSLSNAEILKGPASSLYGAGTGGAVILNTPGLKNVQDKTETSFKLQLQGGSYGQFSENAQWKMNKKNYSFQLSQSHLQCDGYRDNSRMRKDVIHFSDDWKISSRDELKFQLLLADLYYQTPGGLNLAQWQANPKQSRQATATLPGAKEQHAAVYNKTVFTGLSNQWQLSKKLSNISSLVFNYTSFKNPFITNYEKRKETSRGLRTKMIYAAIENNTSLKFIAGAEWQTTFAHIDNYGNKAGMADTVQTKDEVNAFQRFYFAQADLSVNKKLFINAGASINQFTYRYTRTTDNPSVKKTKKFDAVVSPRFSLSYLLLDKISVRGIVSKGFSAPTIAEVRPSEGSFFESLQPEYGWNYEAGLRGSLFKNHFQFDISAYTFNLSNAIVRRTANNGAEYFVNAGGTKQQGIEAMLAYIVVDSKEKFISLLKLSSSLTFNKYRFKDYKINTADYSGNKLTGVPDKIIVSSLDIEFKNKIFLYVTHNYTSKLPLTDANTAFADDYHLLQCKLGWKIKMKKLVAEIFAGADNILNEKYSLGNDLNAAGNRFYNAAPLRNYFAGISINF